MVVGIATMDMAGDATLMPTVLMWMLMLMGMTVARAIGMYMLVVVVFMPIAVNMFMIMAVVGLVSMMMMGGRSFAALHGTHGRLGAVVTSAMTAHHATSSSSSMVLIKSSSPAMRSTWREPHAHGV